MADAFTRDRFRWLDQVLADPNVSAASFRLAYVLTRYFNRQTGDAWPNQETLAKDLGISVRAVRDLPDALVRYGHLAMVVGVGKGKSTHYRPIHKPDFDQPQTRKPASANGASEKGNRASAYHGSSKGEGGFLFPEIKSGSATSPKEEVQRRQKRKSASSKRGSALPPIPLKDSFEETIDESIERRARKKPRTSMPSDWPTEKDKRWAIERWRKAGRHDLIDRIEDEAEKARNKHLSLGTLSANWAATFRTWANKSIEYEKPQHATDRPRSGAASAIWGARQAAEGFGNE